MMATPLAHAAADQARDPATIRDGFHHTAWSAKEGAPAGIWTITQTTDGWLWLGSGSGLYRFDGVSFERIDLLPATSLESRSVRSVLATHDGGLWVILASGRTALLAASDRTRPLWVTGVPASERIDQMTEDGAGNVWGFTATSRPYRVERGTWRALDPDWAFPSGELESVVVDPHGDLWVASSIELGLLRTGSTRFERPVTNWTKGATLGVSQAGQLWLSDVKGYRLLEWSNAEDFRGSPGPLHLPPPDGAALLAQDRSWWSVDCPSGVCRASPNGSGTPQSAQQFKDDTFTRLDGLTSDRPMIAFEDKEGDIWIGTKQGLDRFHQNDFVRVRFPMPLNYFTMAVDTKSGIWSGTDSGYDATPDRLWKIDPVPVPLPRDAAAMGAVFVDSDSSTLFGGTGSLWSLMDGRLTRRDLPVLPNSAKIRTIAKDDRGRLWASFLGDRTYRLDDRTWVAKGGLEQLHDGVASAMARDPDGSLWIGFTDNAISRVRSDQVISYTGSEGLGLGPVTAISPGSPTLVGGEFGVDMFIGGRFVPLQIEQPQALKGISGIVRARGGDLWFFGSAGAVQIAAVEFERAIKDPSHRTESRVFDADDGLPSGAQQSIGAPSVIEDRQGRLWFATSDGMVWLQPQALQKSTRSPVVQILGLTTDQATYAAVADLELPSGTRNLAIRYTALSLRMPERVRFRFRLIGLENEWREMGAARSVTYSNLGPGIYTARVVARTESAVWTDQGAELTFSIRAAFYQTIWFKAVCVVMVLASLIALSRLQGRRAASRAASRMEERLRERERIARELHDTLLQDVQALSLNLRALHLKHGDASPVSADLVRLDEAAQRSLTDARNRVTGLRISRGVDELEVIFREFGDQLVALYPARFLVECRGTRMPLHSVAADEIEAIGREALLNAFRHSGAQVISASITYSPRELLVQIADDGTGFLMDGLSGPESGRHWGLHGMRERARSLKAELSIETVEEGGTRVRLRVPAATAFGSP